MPCVFCSILNMFMSLPLHISTLSLIHKSHLKEVFEVGLVVRFALQQSSSIELAGAEADVRLHVCELRRQQVSY